MALKEAKVMLKLSLVCLGLYESGSQTFWAADPFAVKYFSRNLWRPGAILEIFRHKPILFQARVCRPRT